MFLLRNSLHLPRLSETNAAFALVLEFVVTAFVDDLYSAKRQRLDSQVHKLWLVEGTEVLSCIFDSVRQYAEYESVPAANDDDVVITGANLRGLGFEAEEVMHVTHLGLRLLDAVLFVHARNFDAVRFQIRDLWRKQQSAGEWGPAALQVLPLSLAIRPRNTHGSISTAVTVVWDPLKCGSSVCTEGYWKHWPPYWGPFHCWSHGHYSAVKEEEGEDMVVVVRELWRRLGCAGSAKGGDTIGLGDAMCAVGSPQMSDTAEAG